MLCERGSEDPAGEANIGYKGRVEKNAALLLPWLPAQYFSGESSGHNEAKKEVARYASSTSP